MNKNQIINEIKSYQLIETKRMINNDGKIIYNIVLGELMAKKSKLDLILEEIKSIKNDIVVLKQDMVEVKKDIVELKSDMAILKREAIKHGWDLSN